MKTKSSPKANKSTIRNINYWFNSILMIELIVIAFCLSFSFVLLILHFC